MDDVYVKHMQALNEAITRAFSVNLNAGSHSVAVDPEVFAQAKARFLQHQNRFVDFVLKELRHQMIAPPTMLFMSRLLKSLEAVPVPAMPLEALRPVRLYLPGTPGFHVMRHHESGPETVVHIKPEKAKVDQSGPVWDMLFAERRVRELLARRTELVPGVPRAALLDVLHDDSERGGVLKFQALLLSWVPQRLRCGPVFDAALMSGVSTCALYRYAELSGQDAGVALNEVLHFVDQFRVGVSGEGRHMLPLWVMQGLLLSEGIVRNITGCVEFLKVPVFHAPLAGFRWLFEFQCSSGGSVPKPHRDMLLEQDFDTL